MKNIVKQYTCSPNGGARIYAFRDEEMARCYHVEVQTGRWTAALVSADGERTGIAPLRDMNDLGEYLNNAFEAVKQKLN